MKTLYYMILLGLFAPLFGSCAWMDEDYVDEVPVADDGSLIVLRFAASDIQKRDLSSSVGVEADITGLDVFAFPLVDGMRGAGKYCGHYSVDDKLLDNASNTLTLKQRKEEFDAGVSYELYIMANCQPDIYATFEDGMTFETLANMVQVDDRIHRTGGSSTTGTAPSTFLMDGKAYVKGNATQTSVILNNNAPTKNVELVVSLNRAAVKVVVTLTADGEKITFPSRESTEESINYNYALLNLRTDVCLLAEGDMPGDAQIVPQTSRVSMTSVSIDEETPTNSTVSVVTYAYPHKWDADGVDANELFVVVNVPVYYKSGEDAEPELHANNYYKVPVSNLEELERNTCYAVTATVSELGASSVIEPVKLENIEFYVAEWSDCEITIGGEADKVNYLYVNQESLELRNISEDHSITFASSSDVTVTIADVYYTNYLGTVIHLDLDDKNGDGKGYSETENSNNYPVINVSYTGLNGEILLHSDVPTNNLKRVIVLEVTNSQKTDTKTITIEQYPLDYITFVEGYYSYRLDFYNTDPTKETTYIYNGSGRYNAIVGPTYNESDGSFKWGNKAACTEYKGTTYFFRSKWYDSTNANRPIRYYYWENNNSTSAASYDNSTTSSLNNPRMYNIQITSTSGTYKLGVPKRDDKNYVENTEENRVLVSPSFMIASQLGATSSLNDVTGAISAAADHCEKYVETYKVGSTIYRYADWRLPTEAELLIIANYQNSASDAMAKVLTSKSYWTANGVVTNPYPDQNNANVSIRCIRDAYKDGELEPNQ